MSICIFFLYFYLVSGDLKRIKSGQINYEYFESDEAPDLIKMEMGFSKPLRDVVPRMELMGVTLDSIRVEYEYAAVDCYETRKQLEESGLGKENPCMPFDQFLKIIELTGVQFSTGIETGKSDRSAWRTQGWIK